MWKVPLFALDYDEREENAVMEVLRSRWLTQGEQTMLFEGNFAAMLKGNSAQSVAQCIAVANCTTALHMSLVCAHVEAGDEVIIPALTFVADANVVHHCGATPVFADCTSMADWNISAATVEPCISERTKAVIAVHYAGFPCDMNELRHICKRRNITLIEDCAHAVGAKYQGEVCGTLGDMACFSFFSNKNLSVGEGGMFVSKDSDIFAKAKLLRSHGMTTLTIDRWKSLSSGYDVVLRGYNYRMDEIRSALGNVQLAKLDDMNEKRKQAVLYYNDRLCASGIVYPFWIREYKQCNPCHHIYPVLLPEHWDRYAFFEHMKSCGVQVSRHYECIQNFSAYRELYSNTPVAQMLSSRIVTLPLYPSMTLDDIDYVVKSIETFHA